MEAPAIRPPEAHFRPRPLRASLALASALMATGLELPAEATTAGPVVEIDAPAGASQRAPAISFEPSSAGGGTYLLVWEDDRNENGMAGGPGTDLYVARVSAAGVQLDAGGIRLLEAAASAGDQTQADVVYNVDTGAHFIVWTDPRSGIADIYGVRFLSSTQFTIGSGSQITASPSDTDGFPSVAQVGSNGFVVAYQTNRSSGGGIQVSAQRLATDVVPLEAPVTIASGFQPVVTEVGRSSAIFAYDNGLGNLAAAQIPATGTLPTITTSSVSSSTSAQTLVDLSTVGSDVVAVWQDARRGANRDIYGTLLDPVSLIPRGSDFPISAASGAQQSPAVSGDTTGALVVWQDRRNTSANAEIFAARLDSSGNVADPEGFAVFTFSGTAFEPAVVKGPSRDYLVAGIRSATPNRLYFRIVRDEPPVGTVTPSGLLTVPADGVSTATISFGGAQGASGFTVVDGTLYDVTLSSTAPTVVEADADPTRAGLQLKSAQGQIFLSLRSTTHEQVTVSISSVEGTSMGSTTVDFLNVAPTVSNVRITPTTPRSVDDLQLSYTYADINGDPEMGTEIVWLRDGALQSAFDGQTTVPSSATRRNEVWRAWVRPSDGMTMNQLRVFSSSVSIGNTPPTASNAVIARAENPSLAPQTGTEISLRYSYNDIDNDAERTTRIVWLDRGTPVTSLEGAMSVPGSMVVKGQVWQVEISPNDGTEYGAVVRTSTLAVINTAPTAGTNTKLTVTERRRVTLDGTSSSDPDPQDVLSYTWTQTTGPTVTLEDADTAQPSFTAPDVQATVATQFRLEVSDGEASSSNAPLHVVDVVAVVDTDRDGRDDEEEAAAGTNPNRTDTDGDLLDDAAEFAIGTNPLDKDSDDDGLRDGSEGQACRNECAPEPMRDSDGDGVIDALQPDADGDGLPDGLELGYANPLADEVIDGFAVLGTNTSSMAFMGDVDVGTRTDPTNPDSDGDGLLDGTEDANMNGRVDDGESDPNDVLDPGISCGSDTDCPNALVCLSTGLCGDDPGTLTCDPLPETVECCSGGCTGGTFVEAVCVVASSTAQCPAGANRCQAGACSFVPPADTDGGGCRCAEPSRSPRLFGLGLLGLLGLVRRRRR